MELKKGRKRMRQFVHNISWNVLFVIFLGAFGVMTPGLACFICENDSGQCGARCRARWQWWHSWIARQMCFDDEWADPEGRRCYCKLQGKRRCDIVKVGGGFESLDSESSGEGCSVKGRIRIEL